MLNLTRGGVMPGRILAENLNVIRKDLKWSQEMLAEKCNLPYETIKNLCTGRTPDPKVSTLQALSKGTGYPMDCLVGNCKHASDERVLLKNYRSCDSHGKNLIGFVAQYVADAFNNCVETKNTNKNLCSVIDEPITEQCRIIPHFKYATIKKEI